jgi:hypothetical protein
MNNVRGVIRNREYYNQVKDYSGLRWGKITPTDLDGFIDFGDKLFVIIELKHGDKKVDRGQELALERLHASIIKSRKRCFVIVARYDTSEDVDVSNCIVDSMRCNGKWKQSEEHITVKCFIDRVLNKYAPEYLGAE